MKDIVNFTGLFGENNLPMTSGFIQVEPLERRSRTYDWEISEHIHSDLYQCFLFWSGDGVFVSENQRTTFQSPCIITVPGNTLHGFIFEPHIVGKVITFNSQLLLDLLDDYPQVYQRINQLQIFPLQTDNEIFTDLRFIGEKVGEEVNDHDFDQLSLRPWLQLLFTTLFKLKVRENIERIVSNNPSLKIINAYQNLIAKNLRTFKYVREYAEELNITTVHLNRICRQVVNKPALRMIHEKVIEEAKKYLLTTEYSISQVAYLLNFNDPAHFTKLFKRYVGVTPTEFRKD